tara:strand:- start:133 stop:1140 length:1008 start_codon:yes stop_codon:yes gene_type:complete
MKWCSNYFGDRMPRRGRINAAAVLMSSCAVSACTPATSYLGIPLRGNIEPQLRALALKASSGDKVAKLNLGTKFETGDGVEQNLRLARQLYLEAATDSGGTRIVHVPAAGRHSRSMSVPFDTGKRNPGLIEARIRFESIDQEIRKRERQARNAGMRSDRFSNDFRVSESEPSILLGAGDKTVPYARQIQPPLRVGSRWTVRGRLNFVELHGNDSRICRALAPAFKLEYQAKTVDCTAAVYSLRRGDGSPRTLYGLQITFDLERSQQLLDDLDIVYPDGTTVLQPSPEDSRDEGKDMCGSFVIAEVGADADNFDVVIAPKQERKVDGDFNGSCPND